MIRQNEVLKKTPEIGAIVINISNISVFILLLLLIF